MHGYYLYTMQLFTAYDLSEDFKCSFRLISRLRGIINETSQITNGTYDFMTSLENAATYP